MDAKHRQAAELVRMAHVSGQRVKALPEGGRPHSVSEAHALQDMVLDGLAEPVAGWKIAAAPSGEIMRGAILASRLLKSPARIPARTMPLLGVEAEVAFRFERDMPRRESPYDADEVAEAVTACPAIEIVDTRFESYQGTAVLDRLVDLMSNGCLILGEAAAEWRRLDYASIGVRLTVNDGEIFSGRGGHSAVDPLVPLVTFLNQYPVRSTVPAGTVVTTGTFSGLRFCEPGQRVRAEFAGLGPVEVTLAA